MQNFKNDILNYVQDDGVKSNCADITFLNQGSNVCTINRALPLQPGQSLTLTANANEIDITIYNFIFTPTVAGGNLLVIIRKVYVS